MRRSGLLPVPTIGHVPPYEGAEPLCEAMDRQFAEWYDETFGLERLKDPARVPAQMLDVMGDMFAADIQPVDRERVKRSKVALAQDRNRRRGMWATVKQLIFDITGIDPKLLVLWHLGDSTDWYSVVGEPADPSWGFGMIFNEMSGWIDINNPVGIRVSGRDEGSNTIMVMKGIFYIDIGMPMTYDEVEQLKGSLVSQMCAYFIVTFGYDDGTGFIPFPNGRIT